MAEKGGKGFSLPKSGKSALKSPGKQLPFVLFSIPAVILCLAYGVYTAGTELDRVEGFR